DPLDRVAEWTGEARLAVTSPPTDLLRVLHRNAFRALPGGEYLPDLVIEYETTGSCWRVRCTGSPSSSWPAWGPLPSAGGTSPTSGPSWPVSTGWSASAFLLPPC